MRKHLGLGLTLAALLGGSWAVAQTAAPGAPAAGAAAPAAGGRGGGGPGGGAPGGGRGAPAAPAGPKIATPTIFPVPGTYTNTTDITPLDTVQGVQFHYTWDGSNPTAASPVYDPVNPIFIAGLYDGQRGLSTGYTLRVLATKAGMANSDVATFAYQVERRDRTAYLSDMVAPGVRMGRDSDNDKFYLVQGTKTYFLIDSGEGQGDLKAYLSQFTGGLPITAIWTHSHPDHIGQSDQFIDNTEYVGAPDRAAVAAFLQRKNVPADKIEANLKSVNDGDTVDVGDRKLQIYLVPGHTPGSIVIFDPKTGNLFSGDALGNSSYLPPDVLWMQGNAKPLDEYLAAERTMRAKLGDRIKLIFTGHNDRPIIGTAYLDNLETAMQNLMDKGDAALTPSIRPAGIKQVVVGDYMTDPNWFGANINPRAYLPAPIDQIASLEVLRVTGASMNADLNPRTADYTATLAGSSGAVTILATPTSTRAKSITIDGKPAQPGQPVSLKIAGNGRAVPVVVTAPDGKTTQTYTVTFKK